MQKSRSWPDPENPAKQDGGSAIQCFKALLVTLLILVRQRISWHSFARPRQVNLAPHKLIFGGPQESEVQTKKCTLRDNIKKSIGITVISSEHYRGKRYPVVTAENGYCLKLIHVNSETNSSEICIHVTSGHHSCSWTLFRIQRSTYVTGTAVQNNRLRRWRFLNWQDVQK